MIRAYQILVITLLCSHVQSLNNGLGLTPPMGWSTWNYFFTDINASLVMSIADQMVSLGLLDLGYNHINIDAGYLLPGRDANNQVIVDTTKFPNGILPVADYVHSKGLKLGVYTDIGHGSCSNGPGSGGFYSIDAKTFASWEIDYLKVDCCGSLDHNQSQWDYWAEFRDALNATGRPIYYSICPTSTAPDSGTAAAYAGREIYSPMSNWTQEMHTEVANSVLVEYVNNVDNWYSPTDTDCINAGAPCGMITNVDAFVQMTSPSFSGPGSWNDCDMLQVCNMGHVNGGMSLNQYQASFSIWAIFASPLILSANLLDPDMECLTTIIMNKEVIAIDQDPLGSAGVLVHQVGNSTADITEQIWVRKLSNNQFAAVLLNRATENANITLQWSYLGISSSQEMQVRDVWQHADLGTFSNTFTPTVQPQSVVMVVLQ